MLRRQKLLRGLLEDVFSRQAAASKSNELLLSAHLRSLSSGPDIGLELEKFASNLRNRFKQKTQPEDELDVEGQYKTAETSLRRNREKAERDFVRSEKLKTKKKNLLGDLKLVFSEEDVARDGLDKFNKPVKTGSEGPDDVGVDRDLGTIAKLARWRRAREGRGAEGEDEGDDLETDVDARFKRQGNEELVRRIRQVSEGKVMRLPMVPPGPKLRVRAPPDNLPTHTLSFEELHPKFKQSPMGEFLSNLGCDGEKFDRICERNPKAFRADPQQAAAMLKMVKGFVELDKDDVVQFVMGRPYLLSLSKEVVEERVRFIRKTLKLNKRDLKEVLMGCPQSLGEGFQAEFESATSFLSDELGVSMSTIRDWTLEYPPFIAEATKEKLESVLGYLKKKLDFKNQNLVYALKREPRLISGQPDSFQKTKMWIVKYGFSTDNVKVLFRAHPEVLMYDLEESIQPNLDWFQSLGYKRPHILRIVAKHPKVLSLNVSLLTENVTKLHRLRFSREEVRTIILRCPLLLEEDLNGDGVKRKLRYLMHGLGKSIKDLTAFPDYLLCDFETQIVARIEFLKHIGRLDSMAWPLMKLYKDPDQKFCVNHAHKPFERYQSFLTDWRTHKDAALNPWEKEVKEIREDIRIAA
ncbi:hypothetical protein BSKO_00999 [Bryopsis sp. KO-2023]|nr:hypothetical protein BSKO_00999 [Bryopsis sp. KO-2023]